MRAQYENTSPWWALTGFVLSLLAAAFVQGAAARVIGGSGLFPNLVLIALFIWSVKRPYFVAPPVLLLVGLVQDLFTGGPFGIWAASYLITFAFTRDREADGAGADLSPMVVRFAAVAAIAQFVAWVAGSAAIGAPASFAGLIGETILTIVVCPVFAWAFARRRERSSFM